MKTRKVFNYDGYKKDQDWNKLIKNTSTLSAAQLWKESEKQYGVMVAQQKAERAHRRELRLAREAEEALLASVGSETI